LKIAWTFSMRGEPIAGQSQQKGLGAIGGIGNVGNEVTPLVIGGVMYVPAGNKIVALDSENGKELWKYQLATGTASSRGVAYWPGDQNNPPRIIFTSGRNLIALNAKTGSIDPGFGNEGTVDMVVRYGGVPTIFQNVVIVGANVLELPQGPPGNSRAYDARTGAKLWEFHTVPQPGEAGHETWLDDGWKERSGTNVWGWQMSVDEQRGLLYMPVDGPSSNYYGGDRPGANLFGNSIVALDAKTGMYKWHFQLVHHDLWDFDNPPAPGLIDVMRNGKKVRALAQIGKTGWMFILDRETGKPVFGVEERKVPAGDVPGEWYSPTQPFPLKPPALARMSFRPEDLVTAGDTTPEHAKACKDTTSPAASTTLARLRRSYFMKTARLRSQLSSSRARRAVPTGAVSRPIRRWATCSRTRRTRDRSVGQRRERRAATTALTSSVRRFLTIARASMGRVHSTLLRLRLESDKDHRHAGRVRNRPGDA
jgi:outer membrane protein assembly factor BamB